MGAKIGLYEPNPKKTRANKSLREGFKKSQNLYFINYETITSLGLRVKTPAGS